MGKGTFINPYTYTCYQSTPIVALRNMVTFGNIPPRTGTNSAVILSPQVTGTNVSR